MASHKAKKKSAVGATILIQRMTLDLKLDG
jgi:hypothetical protein